MSRRVSKILFNDTEEFMLNLYSAIKDYYLQAAQLYEQRQQIYFALLVALVGGEIVVITTKESWTHQAFFVGFIFLFLFGMVFYGHAKFYDVLRLDMAGRLDIYSLRWFHANQCEGKVEMFLLLDGIWQSLYQTDDNRLSPRKRIIRCFSSKKFFKYNIRFLSGFSHGAVIAVINCLCFSGIVWYILAFYNNINNLVSIIIAFLLSLCLYEIHVYWYETTINSVFLKYQDKFSEFKKSFDEKDKKIFEQKGESSRK